MEFYIVTPTPYGAMEIKKGTIEDSDRVFHKPYSLVSTSQEAIELKQEYRDPCLEQSLNTLVEKQECIEIKQEDIESDSENCSEELILSRGELGTVNQDSRRPRGTLIETSIDNENSQNIGHDTDTEEFQYICNTVHEDVEVENTYESPHVSDFEEGTSSNKVLNIVDNTVIQKPGTGDPLAALSHEVEEKMLRDGIFPNNKPPRNRFSCRRVHNEEILEIIKPDCSGFGCAYCQYFSTNRQHMIHHIRFVHLDEDIIKKVKRRKKLKQCPHCPTKCTTLNTHILNFHTKPEDIDWLYCEHCSHKTKTKQLLREHILVHHTDPSLYELVTCDECGKKFRNIARLNSHIKFVHHPGRIGRLKCNYCDFSAKKMYDVKRHELRHVTPAEGLKCSKCGFHAKDVNDLTRHHRSIHHKWILCHLCPRRCATVHVFKQHMIHHQEHKKDEDLTYRCKKCDYKTYRSYSLQIHMLNHMKPEEMKMFYCYHCDFKANRKDNLKTHIFKHDIYKSILCCFVCSFKTRSAYELTRHVDIHSKEQRIEAEKKKIGIKKKQTKPKENTNKNKRKRVKSDDEIVDVKPRRVTRARAKENQEKIETS